MTHFSLNNNQLMAEDISLTAIAEQYGTPTYVYSRAALTENFLAYADALQGQPHLVCFAVKANSNIAVLNVLAKLGAGFDIVSVGELERVLLAGGDPSKIVFSGLGKQPHEMQRALDVGVHCFNIESQAELETLNNVAAACGKVADISVRVNPDVDAETHPYISTGLKENKFGIDIDLALNVYERASQCSNINIKGIDCHIGSQLTQLTPFLDAIDRVLLLVDELRKKGISLQHIDLGGGLGVVYNDETPPTPAEYVAAISEKLTGCGLTIILEPGRSIAANAGVLLTRVTYLKCGEHKNFAIIDGAMNDFIRPALYQSWLSIEPVVPRLEGTPLTYDLVGPICETGDFLGKDRDLILEADDLLAVKGAGAYGFVMSSNYNSRGRAPEVMVDGKTSHLVRQRETLEDLVRGETLLP